MYRQESGFSISQDGKAEFNDISARGRIETVVFSERKISAISGTFYVSDAASLKQPIAPDDESSSWTVTSSAGMTF